MQIQGQVEVRLWEELPNLVRMGAGKAGSEEDPASAPHPPPVFENSALGRRGSCRGGEGGGGCRDPLR